MRKLIFLFLCTCLFLNLRAQIIVDNTAPYNNPTFMVDNILLGGGVTASNISYQGDSCQIGFFNAINTSLGIDSGIVLCTGDVNDLDPASPMTFPFISNTVTDPDLLAVANSVPGMIGQTFSVTSVNDIAILEFDFIPSSDSLKFRYAFGSQEYFGFENSAFNDVFGFFLSGPGIAGPWANGAVNLAFVPNTNPPLPITISSVCNWPGGFPPAVMNPQYFIDNQNGLDTIADADGYTTVFTAEAAVQCGATYHIKLAIADGTDSGLSSYVWLEAGSFSSPELEVVDNLGIDSSIINVPCGVEVILTASGVSGANYEWYDSLDVLVSTDSTITISNGSYYVIASDSSGCYTISDTFSILSPNFALNDFTVSHTDVNCWDGTVGTISLSIDDYVNVISYNFWLDGNLNTNSHPLDTLFEGVSAGNHLVEIVDSLYLCDTSFYVSISAPALPLQALVSTSTNVCYGSNLGVAVGSGAGGTPFVGGASDYDYEWFDAGYNSFSVNDTAFGLSAGSYYLEVVDANGCDTFAVVNVIEPSTALDGSPQLFNVSCKGDSTGMLVGNASGSWAPYTYYWLNMQGDTLQTSLPNINTRDTLANLEAGNYQLHVWDSQDCFVNYVLNVSEPGSTLSIDSMKVIDPIACFGDSVGRARLYFSGGDPNYSYLWDNGETTLIAEELTSGLHSVTLTDAWGCEITSSIYMPENSLIESDLVLTTPVSCYGESNGSATISTTGGNSNVYTYFWSTGQQTSGVSTDFASGLLHGSYYVTTRDDLGCEVVDSVYISEPDPLIMEASLLDWIDCYGESNGLAFAVAQGGTPSYTFSSSIGVWPSDTVGTLPAGLSTVVVTDARGCTASDTVYVYEPDLLVIDIDDTQTILAYCTGINTASLSGVASGGTPGYTYVWDDNLVQPQTTATATSLLAGIYTITVTDSKGCTASATEDITMITNSMTSDTSSLTLGLYIGDYDVSCYGEDDAQAVVIASGGHAPYTYDWYGPNGYTSNSATISNLIAGTYSVTIRDTNDCMVNTSILITEPAQMFFTTLASIDESCLGACDGEIQVDVTGGVSPYIPIATNQIGGLSGSVMVDSTNILNVCSGTYVVSFTDQNSCPAILLNGGVSTQTIAPVVTTNAQIDMNSTINVLCNGLATGYLQVLNPNPDTAYTYHWQDLNGDTISLADTAANLSAGTYVLYEDYNNTAGCTTTDTVIVTEGPAITLSSVITNLSCNGDPTGSISVSQITGGTQPYSYLWNTGATVNSINNLSAGIYTLNITDSNGCQQLHTFEITEPEALTITVDNSTSYVLEVASISGGVPSYNYSWIDENGTVVETNSTFIVVNYGTYYLEVEDANGCIGLSSGFTFTATGQVDLLATMDLNIYPNPFNKETTVDFGREIKDAAIRIIDVFGKIVEVHEIKNQDSYIIKRGDKASGIYFMEMEVNNEYLNNFKLVIE